MKQERRGTPARASSVTRWIGIELGGAGGEVGGGEAIGCGGVGQARIGVKIKDGIDSGES